MIPILLLFALFTVAVLRSPSLVASSGIGSAIIVSAPLILATYALTVVVMAGRGGVDLSIGPLIGFINVTLVELNGDGVVTGIVEVFLYSIGVGVLYQLLMGLIIIYVRIQPIIVALSGFLTLSGLNLLILPRPGGIAPDWMMPWGLGETIWSPVLAILLVATGGWFLFTRTAFFDHLRLMGSEERTAYTAGVNITAVRLGAHVIAGIYAGLAALTFTSLISSGDPTQGSRYTLMAVTALVLGGTSLAGGRGTIIGSLLGAVNIYLITYVLATFNFGMVQSFVTQLAYGVILVAALLLTLFLPQIQRYLRNLSPVVVFIVLGLAGMGVVLYEQDEVRSAAAARAVGQSLSGQSLSGQSLSGQSLSGQSLSGQSLSGQSLAGESATGQSLSGQSLSGQSLSGQSLSGQSLSGQSLSAANTEEVEPVGTPVLVAIVLIALTIFLVWMFYRHFTFSSLALLASVVLLVLGYAAYDGATPETPQEIAAAAPLFSPFDLSGRTADTAGAGAGLLASPYLSVGIVAVCALLLGTVLIFTTVPQARGRIGNTALAFMSVLGAAITALLFYEREGFGLTDDSLFFEALGAIVVALLLFIVTLPTFAGRVRNITMVMVALLSLVVLGATFFAGGAEPAAAPPAAAQPIAPTAPSAPASAVLPELFFVSVFWILAAGSMLFLLMIPGVRRHVLSRIVPDRRARSFSYTGIFIAVTATVGLGATFLVGGIEMWKFVVALIAGVIGARFAFSFLRDFRNMFGLSDALKQRMKVPRELTKRGARATR